MGFNSILALILSAALAVPSFALTRIGGAGAVAGKVNAVSQGEAAVGHIVQSGKPLYLNDHVTTDSAGRLQVLLLDETVFTLGPDTDMVLDEFVYDPSNEVGKVTARVTKGVFRFVTGKVARNKPSDMKVNLPAGTIGIRGTIVAGVVSGMASTVMLAGPGPQNNTGSRVGSISVGNSKGEVTISKTNWSTTLAGPDSAPTTPGPTPPEVLSQLGAGLGSKPASTAQDDQSSAGAGQGSATADSGQSSADALEGAVQSLATALAGESSDETTTVATQTGQRTSAFADGAALWDHVRSINTGTACYFSGEAPVSCSGTGCFAANNSGSLQLEINFGARTIGGGSSFIHVHNVYSSNDTLQQTISTINYGSLGGSATITLDNSNLGSYTGGGTGDFTGSKVSLVNAGGVAGASAKVDLTFSGANASASSVSVSGSFTAPR